jgi:ABC-type antimicrobial peptide transport system permease subunit
MGIRMAIGARNRDILLQFLFEAVMIFLAGRFIGAVLGIACAYFYSQINGTLVVVTLKLGLAGVWGCRECWRVFWILSGAESG